MNKIKNYINGSSIGSSNQYIPVEDPSTCEIISKVINSSEEDFEKCIQSSKKAFYEWSEVTPLRRSRVLSKFKENIEKDLENIAKIVSIEHGKTLDDAIGSVTRGLEVVEFACGIPHLIKGEFSNNCTLFGNVSIIALTNFPGCNKIPPFV